MKIRNVALATKWNKINLMYKNKMNNKNKEIKMTKVHNISKIKRNPEHTKANPINTLIVYNLY